MAVKLEQEHNGKVICFVIAKLSFFTDPHTQFKVDCLLFNHGNTKHWAKNKNSSHHPPHYFKWLVCTDDLLKWKPTYFLSQKKKTINNDPVLWKDNPSTMEFKRFFLPRSYRSWYTRLHRTLFNRESKNQMQTNSTS